MQSKLQPLVWLLRVDTVLSGRCPATRHRTTKWQSYSFHSVKCDQEYISTATRQDWPLSSDWHLESFCFFATVAIKCRVLPLLSLLGYKVFTTKAAELLRLPEIHENDWNNQKFRVVYQSRRDRDVSAAWISLFNLLLRRAFTTPSRAHWPDEKVISFYQLPAIYIRRRGWWPTTTIQNKFRINVFIRPSLLFQESIR